MTTATVYGRAKLGVEAPLVTIETHLSNGLPAFNLVGLPETTVRESKERVRSAIINSGYEFPSRRITVNLAPADLPKNGGRFDLPIALGILAASHQIKSDQIADFEYIGELALSGELRSVTGILPAALAVQSARRGLLVAHGNVHEAGLVETVPVYGGETLSAVCRHIDGSDPLVRHRTRRVDAAPHETGIDISDIRGQFQGKRALEVAASGGHNVLFIGPPGTGKTMIATRLLSLLPPLDDKAAFETAAIQSIGDVGFNINQWRARPFRAPHHSSSAVSLIGGGAIPRPGEVSLAHHGVLFLDELPEFERRVLEVLREPLESGKVSISRAARKVEFPAKFQFIAAMNPCPCGYFGDSSNRCACSFDQIERYRRRISGPLLDRIDLQIEITRQPDWLSNTASDDDDNSATVRSRVIGARGIQNKRQKKLNQHLSVKELESFAPLDPPSKDFMYQVFERFLLSPRSYHRIVKVSRTIADLAGETQIHLRHLQEAVSLRCLDRSTTLRY